MDGRERDERKLDRAEGMAARAVRLTLSWDGYDRKRNKRIERLLRQAERILEIRLIRYAALRKQGLSPRP